MKEKALTIDEAVALREEYSDLIGQLFCREYPSLGNIVAVAVSPFGKLDKYYFLQQYKLHGDATIALSSYSGDQFDAVIIGFDDNGDPLCRDLRAHLAYVASQSDIFIDLD